jgi:hypothetical protein
VGQLFKPPKGFSPPSNGNGMAPLAAVSVQGTLPYRPQVFGERGVASCDVGQLFKPSKDSSARAPETDCCPSLQ